MNGKQRFATVVLLALFAGALPGCLLVAAGAAGAAIVATTSEDTAQVDLKAKPADVFDAASTEVESRGNVTFASPDKTKLEGKIGGSSVTVKVFVVGMRTRLEVKARKLGGTLPDLDLAKSIATKVSHSF